MNKYQPILSLNPIVKPVLAIIMYEPVSTDRNHDSNQRINQEQQLWAGVNQY